jgi:glycosyltransferase involved in cell wall biosynthesis
MAHVAFVLPDLAGGGAERVTLSLIREFLAQGHSVDLVLLRKTGELLDLVPREARIIDLNAPRMRNALYPLWRYLRRERLDAVHVAMWPLTSIAIFAHLISGSRARLVVSEHTILTSEYGYYGPLRRTFMAASIRWLFPRAAGRVVVSAASADALSTFAQLPRNSLAVIHNPIEIPAAIRPSPQVETLWAGEGSRILAVGSLKPAKNYPLLLRAFARLANQATELMIVGEGPLREELEELARDLGVGDRVIMPGFFHDPWPFYASADLFVLSSDYEGFGNVLVEAMLAGLRIVSTDCPAGPKEILDGGRYGCLVPCGDAQALANAIDRALTAPHDPEELHRRADALSGAVAVDRYRELMLGEAAATEVQGVA